MKITEVRISLIDDKYIEGRLRAFASVLFDDCFVIRDMRIIDGEYGLFVTFPARKISSRCADCNTRNPIVAHYCNKCGRKISKQLDPCVRTLVDVAHPISTDFRDEIEERVVNAYLDELDRNKSTQRVSNESRL